MKNEAHIIRKPQFIIRDGPGALIETLNETRLIFNLRIGLDESLHFTESILENYEINDHRLLALLSTEEEKKIKILDMLTNEVLNKGSMEVIYNSKRFPHWYICHGTFENPHIWLGRSIKSVLYKPNQNNNFSCPICHKSMNNCTSVRFVMACPDGHLDDINWEVALHVKQKKCKKKENEEELYIWDAKSTNLGSITISCPYCNISATMKEIYYNPFFCTGLFQERFKTRPPGTSTCDKEMKVIQKNSSALRLSSIINLLVIPKFSGPLGELFSHDYNMSSKINTLIKSVFVFIPSVDDKKKAIIQIINDEYRGPSIDEIIDYINKTELDQIIDEMRILFNPNIKFIDCMDEEFETLQGSSISGKYFEKEDFQLIKHSITSFPGLKLSKVNLLQTITVQRGYRRVPYSKDSRGNTIKSKVVDIGEKLGIYKWYPAFRSLGEALFITFTEGNEIFLKGFDYISRQEFMNIIQKGEGLEKKSKDIVDAWIKSSKEASIENVIEGPIVDWSAINHEPLFVWLHTLSHSLIKNIAIYAGYNSASLKERIYVKKDHNGKVVNGGILIYVTSAGTDGGMGGLTQLASIIHEILNISVESLINCSNDPLCDEKVKEENMKNGAACHSCMLISETSCEHRNSYLDRHLITRL